ncbi:MAG: GWxTD domain-containing protein [Rubricoccaceae bacterium]|nr:GWxTD domain-containing protein [Rubricoccaceae bacterium]
MRFPSAGRLRALPLAGLVLAALGSCSGPSPLDSPDAGRSAAYAPGQPNFDLEARATLEDGAPGLDLLLSLPRASLVYTRQPDGFRARYRFEVALEAERGGPPVRLTLDDTLRVPDFEATRSFRPVVREERVALAPGTYLVEATLVDEESGKEEGRRLRVEVPPPAGDPAMSRIGLAIKRPGEGFEPQVALVVPTGFDSLRASVEVYRAPEDAALRLQLDRLRADTTVARPPYWLSYSRASIQYRGLDLDGPPEDTLQVTTRDLGGAAEAVTVEVTLPPLDPGVYRLQMATRAALGAAPFAEEERLFAVREPDFPRLTEVDDLIAPLAYLASERELEAIADGATPAERRARFDAFWGSLFNDRNAAADVLRRYYERVEEANLLFTTYKEGWKTDRGMVYVVLGPPEFVETTPLEETWHYAFGSGQALSTYTFDRASTAELRPRTAFESWILVRSPAYEAAWRRAVQRWRAGQAR